MDREQLAEKIKLVKKEIMYAGPVHKRDLRKHLKRMIVQLEQYDQYRAAAGYGRNNENVRLS